MKIPSLILRQLYNFGSLENVPGGVRFALKNRLSDATLTGVTGLQIDGLELALDGVTLELGDGETVAATAVSEENPIPFPLRKTVHVQAEDGSLSMGKHKIAIGSCRTPLRARNGDHGYEYTTLPVARKPWQGSQAGVADRESDASWLKGCLAKPS